MTTSLQIMHNAGGKEALEADMQYQTWGFLGSILIGSEIKALG